MTDPVAFVALTLSAGTAGFTVYAWRRQNTLLEQQVAGEAADRVAHRAAEVHVTRAERQVWSGSWSTSSTS